MILGNVCGHYVAIQVDEIEKVSEGGIVLAESFDKNLANRVEVASTKGVVVDVGAMAWKAYDGNDPDWKPWAEVGHTVYFKKHSAKIIEYEEDGQKKKLFITADENICWNCGKLEEKDDE